VPLSESYAMYYLSETDPRDAMGLGGKDEVGVGSMGIYIIALDPSNGNPIWHARIGQVTNAPETYLVDGHQFILVAAGDMLYAFTLH
jgi:alcohol dehydrogenase (cytochrome c)